ncbi:MAG: hypothetical protein SWH78_00125 [Thermodesulfobacteriota bacterium]|nr:hypothetical protein [Thermodesulfobacteriota bacterium]
MTRACKRFKHVFLLLLLAASLLFSPETTASQGTALRLDFKERTLSANIDDTPLRAVLDAIRKQKGIRFQTKKGADFLLNEKISVRFRQLPMQEALGRILTGMNHCLVFKGDSVFRVMLFGKVEKKRYTERRRARRPRRSFRRR